MEAFGIGTRLALFGGASAIPSAVLVKIIDKIHTEQFAVVSHSRPSAIQKWSDWLTN
jgi:hypothetical protein